ncbi:conserved hypothetical protein [Desulfurivibrio alkaliphilus AHT 2]|uniref:Uncharacterized protein n=2 Tax=Desulfurivibrio alkaliphilus TaxID=427923 RepID=D6Z503_DESAT|nr:conserved hypothetical protein [Desulfurivibrio alkaliphilus AHT 2]
MALISIDNIGKQVRQRLNKMTPPAGLEILTYKRNRGLAVFKQEDGTLQVREWGYEENAFTTTMDELPRLLKVIAKREFPRSRKVRFYQLESPEEAGREMKKL